MIKIEDMIHYHKTKADNATTPRKQIAHRNTEAILLAYQLEKNFAQVKVYQKK